MEELLLDEAKHSSRIFRRSLQNLFNLHLDDLVCDDTELKTEGHRTEDAEIVADETDHGSPEKDVLPAPRDEPIHQDATIC